MDRYIDAEKLIAEIEQQREKCADIAADERNEEVAEYYRGKEVAYDETSTLITSLQREQPEVDLEKEIEMYISSKKLLDYAFLIPSIARHFYELGQHIKYQQDRVEFAKLKAKEWQEGYDEGYAKGLNARNEEISLPSNLNEAAENRVTENGRFEITPFEKMRIDDIMFGAEWMAGQGESHETEIVSRVTGNGLLPAVTCLVNKSYKEGDKVVVQIRKK